MNICLNIRKYILHKIMTINCNIIMFIFILIKRTQETSII